MTAEQRAGMLAFAAYTKELKTAFLLMDLAKNTIAKDIDETIKETESGTK
jgi:hypothetical protein